MCLSPRRPPVRWFRAVRNHSAQVSIPQRAQFIQNDRFREVVGGGSVGFATGLLGSMAGLGGGPFCVPLLAATLGLTHKQCVGTSLVCALSTLFVGGFSTYMNAQCTVSVLPIMILGGIAPGFGYLAAQYSQHISQTVLKKLFAVFLLTSSCVVYYRVFVKGSQNGEKSKLQIFTQTQSGFIAFHIVLAAVAGTASGLLGIAGGSVVVPFMSMAEVAPWQVITSTSLLSMIPTSATSLATHWSLGNVCRPLVPSLFVGTCSGACIGPNILSGVDEDTRKVISATILLITSIVMAVR